MRRMRLSLICILTLIGTAGSSGGARADVVFSGVCTVNFTLSFHSPISLTSSPIHIDSFDGGGTCTTNADTSSIPTTLTKTISIDATGVDETDDVTTCALIVADGSFIVNFSPAPVPTSPIAGTWVFVGDTAGGTLTMVSGMSPILVGVTSLVVQPLSAVLPMPTTHSNVNKAANCATLGSWRTLSYTGVLVFGDP